MSHKTLNNTAYHYDTKQDDSDGYYGYDVNEKVVKSDYVMDQPQVQLCQPQVFHDRTHFLPHKRYISWVDTESVSLVSLLAGYVMDQTLVLEQDEPISTLGSRSSFIISYNT
jgi:hypothetical protein